jgi:hypothetical protein
MIESDMINTWQPTASGPFVSFGGFTIYLYRNNFQVIVSWPNIGSTGNSTANPITVGTIPRGFRPKITVYTLVKITNAGTVTSGMVKIHTDGVMTVYTTPAEANFTSSTSTHQLWAGSSSYYAEYTS